MPNPMSPLRAFPGPMPVTGMGVATGQPRVGYMRAPQFGKYFVYLHQFVPLAASAVRAQNSFGIDGSFDFLVQKRTLLFDNGGVILQTALSPNGENFENVPGIYGSAAWGDGQFPEIVGGGVPIALPRNSIYTCFATDAQGTPAENNIYLAHHGCKVARNYDSAGNLLPMIPQRYYPWAKPFLYPATFNAFTFDNNGNATGPIPAGQTRIFNLTIDSDSDFDVHAISVVSDASITLQINSDSDNWFDKALLSDLLGGSQIELMTTINQFSGQHPFKLPAPRLITAAGYLTVTVANQDQEADTNVQVVFHGHRLYPGGGASS